MNQQDGGQDLLWTHDLLWAKARTYMDRALGEHRDNELFPFWSSLALEFLARATLAHVHPVLLASEGERDGRHILYALGFTPKVKNFIPHSIPTADVFRRCEQIVPEFTAELAKFCSGIAGRRNEELHSGGLPFGGFANKLWLPRFYRSCEVLLHFQGKSLVELVGADEYVKAAYELMTADADAAAMSVRKEIAAHGTVWDAKGEDERNELEERARRSAEPSLGHVVACPACNCAALLRGDEIRQLPPRLEDDELVVRHEMLPTRFECSACGLKIEGHSQIHASGLGGVFTNTVRYDPMEYYAASEYDGEEYFNE